MDERFRGHLGYINEIQMRSQRPETIFPNDSNKPISNFRDQNFVAAPILENNFPNQNCKDFNFFPPDTTPSKVATGSSVNHEEDSPEDSDFSDAVLKYINRMLMEEDVEENTCMLQDSLKLQAAEKSFYEVLGKKYPSSPEQNVYENWESQDCSFMQNLSEQQSPNFPIYSKSQSSFTVVTNTVDGLAHSQNSTIHFTDWNGKIHSIYGLRKGVEEPTKFLPRGSNLVVNLDASMVEPEELTVGNGDDLMGQEEKKDEGEHSDSWMKGRKHLCTKNSVAEEERSRKQRVYQDLSVRSELFDTVLLSSSLPSQTAVFALQEAMPNGTGKLPRVTTGGTGCDEKQNGK